jgi:hypothetical protein
MLWTDYQHSVLDVLAVNGVGDYVQHLDQSPGINNNTK